MKVTKANNYKIFTYYIIWPKRVELDLVENAAEVAEKLWNAEEEEGEVEWLREEESEEVE